MSRTLWFGIAVCAAIAIFFAFSEGESKAEQTFPELHDTMLAEVRALPGYDLEPETFDRYFESVHLAACRTVFIERELSPEIPENVIQYTAEVYRAMSDLALSEDRADLTDVVTRAFIKVARENE